MYTAETLKDQIEASKAKIQIQRDRYRVWYSKLMPWNKDLWTIVAAVLQAAARYHTAEITRAKHDVLRYALGFDPEQRDRARLAMEHLDEALEDLDRNLQDLEEAEEAMRAAAHDSGTTGIVAKMNLDTAKTIVEITTVQLQDLVVRIERLIYDGGE